MGAAEKQASDFESLSFIHTVLWAHVIIPLNPLTKKPCIKGWREITENTDAELEEWNRQFPNAMVGILTGRPSGFFAIDLDVRKGNSTAMRRFVISKSNMGSCRTPSKRPHPAAVDTITSSCRPVFASVIVQANSRPASTFALRVGTSSRLAV